MATAAICSKVVMLFLLVVVLNVCVVWGEGDGWCCVGRGGGVVCREGGGWRYLFIQLNIFKPLDGYSCYLL